MDPSAAKGNRQALPTMSPAWPDPVLAPDRALSQSAGPTRRHLVPIVVPVLASQVVVMDLAASMLAAPVSQHSVATGCAVSDAASRCWCRRCPQ